MSILKQSEAVEQLLCLEDFYVTTECLVQYINRGQGMVREISARIGEISLVLGMDQDYGEFQLDENNRVVAQLQLTLTINPDHFISKPEAEAASTGEAQTTQP